MRKIHLARWIISLLSTFLSRERSTPLIRPQTIDWNDSLVPQTVRVNGDTIFYVVKGAGDPLVLIHGYGAAIWLWEKQIDLLSSRYKVYALDLLGHGFSDRPRMAYTPEAYIRFFRNFMDAVGVEKATLIGNSMGGGLAWSVAGLFPERVDKLVLIDCIPPDVLRQVRNDSFRKLAALERFPVLLYWVYANRNRDSVKWILQECVTDKTRITPEVVDRQYRFSRIKGTTWSLYSTFRNAKDAMRLGECLPRIDRPTLIIWGEDDLLFPPSVGKALNRAIPGSKLHIVEKSGHIPMWETPEKVNPLIVDFLSG
jgi:pimeloyl-ACP methyl ester carboxylesterase